MGKAEIISGGTDGEYTVRILLDRARVEGEIAVLETQISALDDRISGMEDGPEKDRVRLQKTALEKRKILIEDTLLMASDPEVAAWCADLTEDLTGQVGTAEIPDERGTVQVLPGYGGGAAYSASRDGRLQPSASGTPAGVFWNWALLPGWQKWRPGYRHGTITAIDYDADTCDVTLEYAFSSAQALGVNQTDTLSGVPIDYMDCNANAFEVGDSVLIQFENRDWNSPKVIGFKTDPKPCGFTLLVRLQGSGLSDRCIVWDIVAAEIRTIYDGDGNEISQPCSYADTATWRSGTNKISSDLITAVGASSYTEDFYDACNCSEWGGDDSEECTDGEPNTSRESPIWNRAGDSKPTDTCDLEHHVTYGWGGTHDQYVLDNACPGINLDFLNSEPGYSCHKMRVDYHWDYDWQNREYGTPPTDGTQVFTYDLKIICPLFGADIEPDNLVRSEVWLYPAVDWELVDRSGQDIDFNYVMPLAAGCYTEDAMAQVYVMQYLVRNWAGGPTEEWTDERAVQIQAAAAEVDNGETQDPRAMSRTTLFETELETLFTSFYTANSIGTDEVRELTMQVEIRK